ncbi:hypothetical protein PRZ03_05060 [Paucibacter sp. hw8]|uniref:Uncharacterized protein n=1 Tax=Roseateles albus TaxID=2987525 RepID=A0ABT5KAI0_9BURK|nr:hypothetical protein [Roseateles albus]
MNGSVRAVAGDELRKNGGNGGAGIRAIGPQEILALNLESRHPKGKHGTETDKSNKRGLHEPHRVGKNTFGLQNSN